MIIRPVYLLPPEPPEPDRRVKLSRRAFFITIGTTLTGGFALGLAARQPAGDVEPSTAPETGSDDTHLEWAIRVAESTEGELVQHAHAFLRVVRQNPNHVTLRRGARALADQVIHERELGNRSQLAQAILIIQRASDIGLGDARTLRELETAARR